MSPSPTRVCGHGGPDGGKGARAAAVGYVEVAGGARGDGGIGVRSGLTPGGLCDGGDRRRRRSLAHPGRRTRGQAPAVGQQGGPGGRRLAPDAGRRGQWRPDTAHR